jgi:hypothetical protein
LPARATQRSAASQSSIGRFFRRLANLGAAG